MNSRIFFEKNGASLSSGFSSLNKDIKSVGFRGTFVLYTSNNCKSNAFINSCIKESGAFSSISSLIASVPHLLCLTCSAISLIKSEASSSAISSSASLVTLKEYDSSIKYPGNSICAYS